MTQLWVQTAPHQLNVFLVEDQPINQMLMPTFLKHAEHAYAMAAIGRHAPIVDDEAKARQENRVQCIEAGIDDFCQNRRLLLPFSR